MIITASITKRFWSKVDKTPGHGPWGDCWLWTAYVDKIAGYGRFGTKYPELVWAHRYAFSSVNGDPGHLVVRHRCDNRPCCNPDHLLSGTSKENTEDMVSRGRHVGYRKITCEDVLCIRNKRSSGINAEDLAEQYKLSDHHIRSICTGKYWPSVGGPLTKRFLISDEIVNKVRQDITKFMWADVAKKYGISWSSVQQIASGKRTTKE